MEAFADVRLGKAVVRCNDTPGFVANRLGVYWIATAIGEALARGLTVEEADALMGAAIGAPAHRRVRADGSGRTRACTSTSPPRSTGCCPPTIRGMRCRRTSTCSGGWSRWAPPGGRRARGSTRASTATAARGRPRDARVPAGATAGAAATPRERPTMPPLRRLRRDRALQGARLRGRDGARGHRPAAADRPRDGARLQLEARPVRADARGHRRRRRRHRCDGPESCCSQTSKHIRRWRATPRPRCGTPATASPASSSTPRPTPSTIDVLEMIERTVAAAGERFRALVIYNEGAFFSTGGNLAHLLTLANVAAWDRLDAVRRARPARRSTASSSRRCRWSARPRAARSAAAARCCCTATRCRRTPRPTWDWSSSASGLLPAWGGCRELLIRASRVGARRADAARGQGVRGDRHRPRLDLGPEREGAGLPAARPTGSPPTATGCWPTPGRFALELADGYVPPEPRMLTVAGPAGQATLELTARQRAATAGATDYDLRAGRRATPGC